MLHLPPSLARATDNKINSTNTFSIALIDYFHDMSLLRSDSGDGSINFQKASCTLDGCVKVWTSRVDSVVSETGKLLNGLVGDGKGGANAGDGEDGDGDLEGDFDEAAGAGGKSSRKKKAKAKEATLVKNFSAIAVKKLDLEYTVDPLFKKTSADFDEGGAGGLLMNHLGVDDKMRVVFDAGEAEGLPEGDGEEEQDDAEEDEEDADKPAAANDTIDLSRMQAKLFSLAPPSLWSDSEDPIATLLTGRLVCPSLGGFSFAPDQEANLFGAADEDDADHADDDEGRDGSPFDLGYMNPAITATPWGGDDDHAFGYNDDDEDSNADLFGVPADLDRDGEVFGLPPERPGMSSQMDHHVNDDGGANFDFMDGGGGGDNDGDFDMEDGSGGPAGNAVRWDPRQGPSQHDLLLAFKGVSGNDDEGQEGAGGADGAPGGLFDYFDQRLMKSWAGPEHWKMRSRLAGFGGLQAHQQQQQQQQQQGNADGAVDGTPSGKKKRSPKEAFVIDFSSSDGPSTKELFEPPRSASSILLSKTRHQPEAFLLPEDRHFSSRMLLRLFSKPRAVLNIRTRRGALRFGGGVGAAGMGSGDNGELDEAFWAQQQAAREADGGFNDDGGADFGGADGDDGGNDAAPMPLDTQFYHDGDDEGAFELATSLPQQTNPNSAADVDVADFEEEDLAAQAAALKRVRPEYVNYAKKAKRVDVRRLKENIWRELAIEPSGEGGGADELGADETTESSRATTTITTPSGEAKTFRSVLSGLRKAYPKDKMDEISTSFCFICLLHLANEEGLEIKIGQRGTGNSGADLAMRNAMLGAMTPGGRVIAEDEEDEDESGEDGEEGGRPTQLPRRRGVGGGVGDDSDDDDDVEEAKSALTVGRLEYLRIKKDPKAGRSA